MKKNKEKISYEREADVLSVELSDAPIDHAEEAGDVVVHFTKDNKPVLLEILEASLFFKKSGKAFIKEGVSARELVGV